MFSFFSPLWLFALPLASLPWFWPIQKQHQTPTPFSSFLLFPPTNWKEKFYFSTQNWFLKLLRSLLIIVLVLTLSKPYWQTQSSIPEYWIIDDTHSVLHTQALEHLDNYKNRELGFTQQQGWYLSDLFPRSTIQPQSTFSDSLKTPASPNFFEIEQALQATLKSSTELVKIHFLSDFQSSQFQWYQFTDTQFLWTLHRPSNLPQHAFFSLNQLRVQQTQNQGFVLQGVLEGRKKDRVIIRAFQNQKVLGDIILNPSDISTSFEIPLISFNRHEPLAVALEEKEGSLVSWKYYQRISLRELTWGAIVFSEGKNQIYRYGLHQLKSGLSANGYSSTLHTSATTLQEYQPDFLVLLGDHPIRWEDYLARWKNKLFIPTRTEDWQPYFSTHSQKTISSFPEDQIQIEWEKVPFANAGQIKRITSALSYSSKWNMWLLNTGISPSWGPLYKDATFATQLRSWLKTILETDGISQNGTIESGSSALTFLDQNNQNLLPGHYEYGEERKHRFSINLPLQEVNLLRLQDEELQQVQEYFSQREVDQEFEEVYASIDQIRKLFLWCILLLAVLELSLVILRLYRTSSSKSPSLSSSKYGE